MLEIMSTETQQVTGVASVTPSYRRNGKLFSCEPVRVSADTTYAPIDMKWADE